jgi:hypothetical protein
MAKKMRYHDRGQPMMGADSVVRTNAEIGSRALLVALLPLLDKMAWREAKRRSKNEI